MPTVRPPLPWGIILAAALSAAFAATLISGFVIMSASNTCVGGRSECVEGQCIPCGPLRNAAQMHVGGQAVLAAAGVFVAWRLQKPRRNWLVTTATVLAAFTALGFFIWWSTWWVDGHS